MDCAAIFIGMAVLVQKEENRLLFGHPKGADHNENFRRKSPEKPRSWRRVIWIHRGLAVDKLYTWKIAMLPGFSGRIRSDLAEPLRRSTTFFQSWATEKLSSDHLWQIWRDISFEMSQYYWDWMWYIMVSLTMVIVRLAFCAGSSSIAIIPLLEKTTTRVFQVSSAVGCGVVSSRRH